MVSGKQSIKHDAWNPGLESSIPDRLMPAATVFRPGNSHVSYQEAKELSEFCGIKPENLIAFRLERLVQHEILVRVTADFSVPDGPNYEELGINMRSMVDTIYSRHLHPELEAIQVEFGSMIGTATKLVLQKLDQDIFAPELPTSKSKQSGFFARLFGAKKSPDKLSRPKEIPELSAIKTWEMQLNESADPLLIDCLKSMITVVGQVTGQRGRLVTDRELTAEIVVNKVRNNYGSQWVSKRISNLINNAAKVEEYRLLSSQEKPVIMNVKGASASGKSTIRPQQRQLAKKLGIPWKDFALISPDYWRKYLLDYDSLGKDYKYAGMLTAQELEIVDKKLDRHMAGKALQGNISHLLIDRFRFDSFAPDFERSSDSKLLTRFGDRIFMFFMITSPTETVERAWSRGGSTGRYKAVDDLLYHNIEAYTGMPELFFSWVLSKDKTVHFEFLDNNVPLGKLPKTAAFGWNKKMTILDLKSMINIDRFKKINIDSKSPDMVFDADELPIEDNLEFLFRCFSLIPEITFADQNNGKVYARLEEGQLIWCNRKYIENSNNRELKVVFNSLQYKTVKSLDEYLEMNTEFEKQFTFGKWS